MPGQADSIHVVLPIKTQSMGVPDYTDSHTVITTTTTICIAPYSRNFTTSVIFKTTKQTHFMAFSPEQLS